MTQSPERSVVAASAETPVSTAGRILFGVAVVGFGLLSLVYLDFVSALQPVPASMPGYQVLAVVSGLVLIAGGAAIVVDRHARVAAVAIAVFFGSWIALLHVPSAFTDPALLRSPWWIRTFETLALIGGVLTLAGSRSHPRKPSMMRNARVAFGVSMPVFGVLHLIYPESVASLVPPWYPWPLFWAYFTGVAQVVGGLAIATGIQAWLASLLAGVMYGMWALTLHVPRTWCRVRGGCEFMAETAGRGDLRSGTTSLFVAVAMCGAAWIVAGGLRQDPDSASDTTGG